MQIITNFPSLIDRWLRYRFQTILVVCFLLWTPFLVAKTLLVQHSCYPMIHWSGTLPAECQPKLSQANSRPSKKAEPLRDRSQEQKQIARSDRSPSPKPLPTSQEQKQKAQSDTSPSPKPSFIPKSDESPPPAKPHAVEDVIKTAEDAIKAAKDYPDITSSVVAIGVASTVAAVVATAPLAVVVAIGAAVWFAIRTVL
ncbi:hypothetical protein [Coleofasciculus sp. H7-2]|uniref:hypothetical protein n=1 Tax=Coleofasciculus sp. H7-2 TaxID=3351545 RepID=UPI003672A22F